MFGNIPLLTLTVIANGPLSANRFINQSGGYPSIGGIAFGVTRTIATIAGDLVPVDVLGTAIVESGAAISREASLQVDATGRVVPLTAGASSVARAMCDCAGAGELIEVLLIPGTAAA